MSKDQVIDCTIILIGMAYEMNIDLFENIGKRLDFLDMLKGETDGAQPN